MGRADDIAKIKGVLDDILLKVELLPGKEGEERHVLAHLKDPLRLKTNLGYPVEVHPYGSLPVTLSSQWIPSSIWSHT